MNARSSLRLCISLLVLLLHATPDPALAQSSPTVTINQVLAEPVVDKSAYKVTAYTTVTDDSGQPLSDLKLDSFSLSQDGAPINLEAAAITPRVATVILVLDTSGSMAYEGKMAAAKDAASAFISSLSAGDQIGIIYFNDEVTVAQKPSTDQQAGRSIVGLLESKLNGGTCLYDAAYTAVNLATSTPPGQRAVVLLTDGIDETPGGGKACSQHTAQEVIDLARQPGFNVPIYGIGVGNRANENDLRGIAKGTGGAASIAPAAGDLDTLFATVAAQLKNQYALTYQTETVSGEHTLTISVNYGGTTGVATRKFIAPELPAVLNLSGMDAGAILKGQKTIRSTVAGKADIGKIVFTLDGAGVSEVSQPPYEVMLDGDKIEPGSHQLAATALLADGTNLKATLDFVVARPESTTSIAGASPATAVNPLSGPLPIAIGAGVLVLLVAFVLVLKRGQGASSLAARRSLSAEAFGILTVQQSVSLQKGHVFELSGSIVRIGRGDENDVVIPDAPISRRHAEIRRTNSDLLVVDLHSTYGTFVNGKKVDDAGLPLKNGGKLKLGTRCLLTFMAISQPEAAMTDRTMDNVAPTIMDFESEGTVMAEVLVPFTGQIPSKETQPTELPGEELQDRDEDTKPPE